jgi:uncharacterized damage-inducible protein DinB
VSAMPPPIADERAGLIEFLRQQRFVLRTAAHGLTDEQARTRSTVSELTVGGLVKHVTATERSWMDTIRQVPSGDWQAYAATFVMTEDDTLAELLADYAKAAEETEELIAGLDLGEPVPVPPAPWNPTDVTHWSVRWVLFHVIEETARHAGHADIVREGVDGATGFPLLAAVEGWPSTPWLQPWEPAAH